LEYLLVHRGGRGCSLVYELLYTSDVESDQAQLMGLIDTDQLRSQCYDAQKLGVKRQKTAPSQCQVSSKSDPLKTVKLNGSNGLAQSGRGNVKSTSLVL
jgi:hypothetical protein